MEPSTSLQSHVTETSKQALQGHSLLMEFYIKDTEWEHILQHRGRVFVGNRIYRFIIRKGFMIL